MITERNGRLCEWRDLSQRSRAEAENKAAESVGEKASVRGKYWRPDLNRSEWNLLNRRLEEEIESSGQYLDESTKWLYADEKGVQVFALYGIGDGTDATPLYAYGGKEAAAYNAAMAKYLEGKEHADKSAVDFDGWIKSHRSAGMDQSRSVLHGGQRGSNGHADGGVYRGSSERTGGSVSGRSSKDQWGVKEKFSLREHGLTEDEEHAIVSYKSGDSYALNGKLATGGKLTELQRSLRDHLDTALEKLPVYRGTVYRHYDFDSFGGYDAMADFLSQFVKGEKTNLGGYLSASTVPNESRTGGEYTVDMVIQSETGRSLNGFGRNTENEVLLPRTTELIADSMELISPHKIRMMAREVINDENGATADPTLSGVRRMRESAPGRENLRPVSGRDSGAVQEEMGRPAGRDRDAGLPGLREGEGPGSMGESGVESDYRAAEEGLKYQPREQSVSDRQRSRYCQRTEFELLFARGRGRIDTYRHKRRTDHGRKEKANFQRDSALRGADARLIYGRD